MSSATAPPCPRSPSAWRTACWVSPKPLRVPALRGCRVPPRHLSATAGVTVSSALDGVAAPPELFPPAGPELPDIVFFFRWAEVGVGRGAERGPGDALNSLWPPQVQRGDAVLRRGPGHHHPPALRPAAAGHRRPGCAQVGPAAGERRRPYGPRASPVSRRPRARAQGACRPRGPRFGDGRHRVPKRNASGRAAARLWTPLWGQPPLYPRVPPQQMPRRHLRWLRFPPPVGDGRGLPALLRQPFPCHRGRVPGRRAGRGARGDGGDSGDAMSPP